MKTPQRFRLRKTITDEQLTDCALSFAAKFAGLRLHSFCLDEIKPGFQSAFPDPVPVGTTRDADIAELNGYRIPVHFCKKSKT